MSRLSIFSVFALAVGFVATQTTSTAPDTFQCILTCSTQAALDAGCVDYTNFACICTSERFQQAAGACILKLCPAQLSTAEQLLRSQCVPSAVSSRSTSTAPTSTTLMATSGGGGGGGSTPSNSAFKNSPVTGAMGALAALVGAATL